MRAGPAALLVLAVGAGAARLSLAQVAPNRTSLYLHPTDVTDARALWVNPAGLGRISEASVHLDLTVRDPGAAGRLQQLTFGIASRGFSLGYQRDLFPGGPRGHTYRVGMASSHKRLSGGAAVTLYRGEASETSWDLGAVYDLLRDVSVGGVIANIGHPVVRGAGLPVTLVPGATLRLFRARAAVSAHSRLTSADRPGYSIGLVARLRDGTTLPVGVLARLDADGWFQHTAFAVGLSVGRDDLVGTVVTVPGAGRIDSASLYGLSTRRLTR